MDNRYILFAGDQYYPFGGFEDYIDSSDSINILKRIAERMPSAGWAHIVDMVDRNIVSTNANNRLDKLSEDDWKDEDVVFTMFSCHQDINPTR